MECVYDSITGFNILVVFISDYLNLSVLIFLVRLRLSLLRFEVTFLLAMLWYFHICFTKLVCPTCVCRFGVKGGS